MSWSMLLSKSIAAAAPAIGVVACELTSTLNVLPVDVVTVGGLMVSVPLPAAKAVAGTRNGATRNIAPADRGASLGRFTWVSLSGIGRGFRTFRAVTPALPG